MKIEKNKKTSIYLITILILVALFFYFKFDDIKTNLYDTSQQGSSEIKGKFIPEQHTDYIFTTVETDFVFYKEFIFLIIVLIIMIIVYKKFWKRSKV